MATIAISIRSCVIAGVAKDTAPAAPAAPGEPAATATTTGDDVEIEEDEQLQQQEPAAREVRVARGLDGRDKQMREDEEVDQAMEVPAAGDGEEPPHLPVGRAFLPQKRSADEPEQESKTPRRVAGFKVCQVADLPMLTDDVDGEMTLAALLPEAQAHVLRRTLRLRRVVLRLAHLVAEKLRPGRARKVEEASAAPKRPQQTGSPLLLEYSVFKKGYFLRCPLSE